MAAVGHFGCPKFMFDRISGHFISIRICLLILYKMATGGHFGCLKITFDCISGLISDQTAILDVWNSLSIRILAISDRYRKFFWRPFMMSENKFWSHIWPFQIDRPFWMSEIHFRWHFWPFQIHTDFNYFLTKWPPGCPKITLDRISGHFTQLLIFFLIFDKMATGGHFGWDDNVNYQNRPRYLDE